MGNRSNAAEEERYQLGDSDRGHDWGGVFVFLGGEWAFLGVKGELERLGSVGRLIDWTVAALGETYSLKPKSCVELGKLDFRSDDGRAQGQRDRLAQRSGHSRTHTEISLIVEDCRSLGGISKKIGEPAKAPRGSSRERQIIGLVCGGDPSARLQAQRTHFEPTTSSSLRVARTQPGFSGFGPRASGRISQ